MGRKLGGDQKRTSEQDRLEPKWLLFDVFGYDTRSHRAEMATDTIYIYIYIYICLVSWDLHRVRKLRLSRVFSHLQCILDLQGTKGKMTKV